MNKEIERYAGELSELRELREFITKKQNYIEAKIQHFDSNIRMSVMSDFDRLAAKELKEFLEELQKRIPIQYMIPPYFG